MATTRTTSRRRWRPGRRAPAKPQVLFDELVEARRLVPIQVHGWKQPAYVVPGVGIPRSVDARAIVSPFDPVMWERKWTKAVFDFDYQIEIYVPGHKRIHGYYVLPFLQGDAITARLDLKADRKAGALLVKSVHAQPGHGLDEIAGPLGAELQRMAGWLGLERVTVEAVGVLAAALKKER